MPLALFHFPRRERLGIILWTLLALLIWWLPQWLPEPALDYEFLPATAASDSTNTRSVSRRRDPDRVALRPFDPNTVTRQELLAFGLPEAAARGWVNYRNAAGDYDELADLRRVRAIPAEELTRLQPYIRFAQRSSAPKQAASARPGPAETEPGSTFISYFSFDPNTITEADLLRLGLTGREATGLLRYRAAGAQFRKADDWLRIRSVPAEKLEALLPYAEFGSATATRPQTTEADPSRPAEYGDAPREIASIDINRASVTEWRRLPGIGEYWSGRILAFRRALGGFVDVAQVAETRGLPDSVFQRIQPYLRPGELLGRIPINSVTQEELARHPYISSRQATVLIAFRHQRKRLTREDLANFKGMPAAELARILPYLSF